jgi:hypothetical protein
LRKKGDAVRDRITPPQIRLTPHDLHERANSFRILAMFVDKYLTTQATTIFREKSCIAVDLPRVTTRFKPSEELSHIVRKKPTRDSSESWLFYLDTMFFHLMMLPQEREYSRNPTYGNPFMFTHLNHHSRSDNGTHANVHSTPSEISNFLT